MEKGKGIKLATNLGNKKRLKKLFSDCDKAKHCGPVLKKLANLLIVNHISARDDPDFNYLFNINEVVCLGIRYNRYVIDCVSFSFKNPLILVPAPSWFFNNSVMYDKETECVPISRAHLFSEFTL